MILMQEFRFRATLSYVLFIILLNIAFVYTPMLHIGHEQAPAATLLAGFIYVLRDLAQRECGHKIWLAMIVGCLISYVIATPAIALASALAFLIGESIDWAIFTLTKLSLSRRILFSASLSAPVDSLVFLYLIHFLNLSSLVFMTVIKLLGVVLLWLSWHIHSTRHQRKRRLVEHE